MSQPGKGNKFFLVREAEDLRVVISYVEKNLLRDRDFVFDNGELDVSNWSNHLLEGPLFNFFFPCFNLGGAFGLLQPTFTTN